MAKITSIILCQDSTSYPGMKNAQIFYFQQHLIEILQRKWMIHFQPRLRIPKMHSGFLKVEFCPYFCHFCDVTLVKLECKMNFFPEAHGKGLNSLGYSRPQELSKNTKNGCS